MKRSFFALALVGLAAIGSSWAADVPQDARSVQPLLIGTEVPEAELAKPDGTKVNLSEILAEDPTVLILYRGGW